MAFMVCNTWHVYARRCQRLYAHSSKAFLQTAASSISPGQYSGSACHNGISRASVHLSVGAVQPARCKLTRDSGHAI